MKIFKIITNEKNWLESLAVDQLLAISNYPGVIQAIGLPDLHAGKYPVGIAVITEDYIYPHLIGNDIGCGMGLFNTGINNRKFKMKKWQNRLNNIRELGDIPVNNPYDELSPIYELGTIGGGNHFVEFQQVEKIFNEEEFIKLGFDRNNILVLVHSGSRSYGQEIIKQFNNLSGYLVRSHEAKEYFRLHDDAIMWAKRNREVVVKKIINWLGYEDQINNIIDCTHNFLEENEAVGYIHRKGVTSGNDGLVVIPGSRGTLTYIVKPVVENIEKSGYSLSHGAGRKWARSLCKSRIKNKYDRDTIRETKLKSKVVCHDTDLLYQEAPEAYKNIDDIIEILIENELIEVVATLRPLITYKG